MRPYIFPITLFFIVVPGLAIAQPAADSVALRQMQSDVRYLSSAELEGREAGTEGEKLAADHIAAAFAQIGLLPAGDEGTYLQSFLFNAQPVIGTGTSLQIGRKKFKLGEEFHPLSFSASGLARGTIEKVGYGIHAPELQHDDLADVDLQGKVAAISISSPDGIHPHSKFLAYHDLHARAEKAAERGAIAVVFYNDDPAAPTPSERLSAQGVQLTIPVIFLKGDLYEGALTNGEPCVISLDIKREQRTAYNVIGWIDNADAENVAVIGAHYDHLGWGDEGSLHRGEKAIHHGADDNASGVSVMLQLARDLKGVVSRNDHLFIAFSGEEKGLYGSNYWTKNPTLPIDRLNYMINMDMVGRLDPAGNLGINGVGTSPAWSVIDSMQVNGLSIKKTTSGIGPSDHTSFYLQDIPAIHYFTGTHADYHKPSDTEEKVNYEGMLLVREHILALIEEVNERGRLEFAKTEDVNTENAPRFKVTLGVVPDYMFDGKGMRIDGVSEGKPAATAGLRTGDIVIRLGEIEVQDMMSYMKALSMFEQGSTTIVVVMRGEERIEKEITF